MATRPSWAIDVLIVDFLRKIDVHISVAILYCCVSPIVIIVILVVKGGCKAVVVVPCGPLELTQANSFGLKVQLVADFRNYKRSFHRQEFLWHTLRSVDPRRCSQCSVVSYSSFLPFLICF